MALQVELQVEVHVEPRSTPLVPAPPSAFSGTHCTTLLRTVEADTDGVSEVEEDADGPSELGPERAADHEVAAAAGHVLTEKGGAVGWGEVVVSGRVLEGFQSGQAMASTVCGSG